jgi:hypothetical protein
MVLGFNPKHGVRLFFYLIYEQKMFLNKSITCCGEYDLYAFQSLFELIIVFIFANIFISSSFELYKIALSCKILICSKSPIGHVIIGLFLLENSARTVRQ